MESRLFNGCHRIWDCELSHVVNILKSLYLNRGQVGSLTQIDTLQVIAALERITSQNLKFGIQRDTNQAVAIIESIVLRAIFSTSGDDILSEYDAYHIASITYRATDVFYLVAISIAICHSIGNHNVSRFRCVGCIRLDAFERGRTIGAVVTVDKLVPVFIGHSHFVCSNRGGQTKPHHQDEHSFKN